MRSLIGLARQGQESLVRHARYFSTDLAPFTPSATNVYTRHAESVPEALSWVSSLSQFQPTKVRTRLPPPTRALDQTAVLPKLPLLRVRFACPSHTLQPPAGVANANSR